MAGRLLMGAYDYDESRHKISGYYAMQAIGGLRTFWDGGISRDQKTQHVPWANTTREYMPIATGLWTRNGAVVNAPDWFLNQLPPFPLDGELHAPGIKDSKRQLARAAQTPAWQTAEYAVFDTPSIHAFIASRKIDTTSYKLELDQDAIERWFTCLDDSRFAEYAFHSPKMKFEEAILWLQESLETQGRIYMQRMYKLHADLTAARKQLNRLFKDTCDAGMNALYLRAPDRAWVPCQSRAFLRYSPFTLGRGVIVGYKGGQWSSKQWGKIAKILVEFENNVLEVSSGIPGDSRDFKTPEMTTAARKGGHTEVLTLDSEHYPLGGFLNFNYQRISGTIQNVILA